jgi:hypothetical protein
MNILITCHKPPGFGHETLYRLNTNGYKKNKTRKNILRNLKNGDDTIHYLDIPGKITYFNNKGKEIPNVRPKNNATNWFPNWEKVPDNSMDIIWAENCPILNPFSIEEVYQIHFDYEVPSHAPFLDPEGSLDDIWRHLLKHGHRILKKGGKIVCPIPLTRDDIITDPLELKLIARIINMETIPDVLYKIHVISPTHAEHKKLLNDIFIAMNINLKIKNNKYKPLDLGKAYSLLVFELP